jgi:sigma-B regulation protein RsbU (phosphoserine phosphatase)
MKQLLTDISIVSEGHLNHKTMPHSTDEIGVLARSFNAMTKRLKIAMEQELKAREIEHELNIAHEIQSNLLPKRIPRLGGYDIGAFYRPSKEVGGDYYDFIDFEDKRHWGIIAADVSGKGIPGSLVMTMAKALISIEAKRNLSTAQTLKNVNRELAKHIRRGMFVTCMYIILDAQSGKILVSSAGHNPLVIWRQKTGKYELVNPNGIALGFDKGPIFEKTIKQEAHQLYPGDRIVTYTDGVVEAMSPGGKEFGDKRFYELVCKIARQTSHEFVNEVVRTLEQHQATAEQHDDITIVTVRLLPQKRGET